MNLNDLKNEMINVPTNAPVFLYIGVGTAAYGGNLHNNNNNNNNNNNIPPEHYHQFPPFLQDLRNRNRNLHLFLLLFDPYQENPPQVVVDYNLVSSNNNRNQTAVQEHYRSSNGQLQTFVYRTNVYTDADIYPPPANALNITADLRDLNQFAIKHHISLLYHDFTGRRTNLIAEYFDQENKDYLEQIIYGLSARENHGCYFDLTQPTAYFPVRLDQPTYNNNNTTTIRPIIKMFNYYKYIVNRNNADSEQKDIQMFSIELLPLIEKQKKQIVDIIIARFKITYLTILRQLRKKIINTTLPPPTLQTDQEYDNLTYMFNDLSKNYREMFFDLYKEKNYKLMYELIFNYSIEELNTVSIIKKMDMTGAEILSFITLDEDPYKWYDAINGLL